MILETTPKWALQETRHSTVESTLPEDAQTTKRYPHNNLPQGLTLTARLRPKHKVEIQLTKSQRNAHNCHAKIPKCHNTLPTNTK